MPVKVWNNGKELHYNELPVTTKGDLATHIGTSPSRLAVGADGSVVTADSSTATGLKYSTATSIGTWVLLSSQTITNATQVVFNNLSSTYFAYLIVIKQMVPSAATDTLEMLTSTDNGSSYQTSAGTYQWQNTRNATSNASQSDTSMRLGGSGTNIGGNALEGCRGMIWLIDPTDSNTRTAYRADLTEHGSGATHAIASTMASGGRLANDATTAVKLYFPGGNITTGTFKMYGLSA